MSRARFKINDVLFSLFQKTGGHIPHDTNEEGEKVEQPTSPPESAFIKLSPSDTRYTILRQRDELQ